MEQIETKNKVTHSLGTEKIGKLIARFAIPSGHLPLGQFPL